MIAFCEALLITGIIFVLLGIGGTFGLKIPQIGYIGGPTGLILIFLSLLFQMMGIC